MEKTTTDVYHCEACDYKTNDPEMIPRHEGSQRHNRILAGEIEYRCLHKKSNLEQCHYRTFDQVLYNFHTESKHTIPEGIIVGKEMYGCDKCCYQTHRYDNVKRHYESFKHQRAEEDIYKFKCYYCHFATNNMKKMKAHQATETHKIFEEIGKAKEKREEKNKQRKLVTKIKCECGSEINDDQIKRHNKTIKHQKWLENQN